MTQTATNELEPLPTSRREQIALSLRRAVPLATTVGVSFGIVALQLAQGILLARLLGPESRGEYATAVLYSQMLLYVGLFGAIEVVCRYAANVTL
jgi:enterobacterial common antigen flippase